MIIHFSPKLKRLAEKFDKPLYAVGGCVRGAILDGTLSDDVDLAGDILPEVFSSALESVGFTFNAEYDRTGTVVFTEKGNSIRYEFTAFRKESYAKGGGHQPIETSFTSDIFEDAKRRDFKCNAIYYDILKDKIVDPLGGVADIQNKILDTVKAPEEVFKSDGLRLMRLARFSGELNFKPTEKVKEGARAYAINICDISGERIYAELTRMLISDQKYRYSDPYGHYNSVKLLHEIGVLKYVFPELVLGAGMPQRKDFHRYDVLEHSFRALLYSKKEVRLSALIHDIGKPVVFLRDGTYHLHPAEGEKIARKRLAELHAPRRVIEDTCWLILNHMYDLRLDKTEKEVKKFIAKNYARLEPLLALKEADILASSENLVPLTVKRWREIIEKMKEEGAPFSLKDLAVNGDDLMEIGIKGKLTGVILQKLFDRALDEPFLNKKDTLISMAKEYFDKLA